MNYLKKLYTSSPLLVISWTSWSLLGCKRGFSLYNYDYNKNMIRYMEEQKENERKKQLNLTQYNKNKPEPFLYTSGILVSFFVGFIYLFPLCLPFTIWKEIQRLEINLRKLEEEKTKRGYYTIF